MTVMWLGCVTIVLLLFGVNAKDYSYKEFYFDQVIDHFNVYWKSVGKETYKQRYLVADQWWQATEQGPILFYTGNEGDIVTFWNNTGFMFEIAPQLGALVIFAEHRYYGKSLPFGDKSFQHPFIDYLSTEQALADYGVLITHLKEKYNALRSPVIAFGGSYGGMLSAYMRFHYPNIVSGSIAASAPIYVVTGQSPREDFFEDVTKDFRDAAPGCLDAIKSAFAVIASLATAGDPGLKNLSATFGLCKQLKTSADYRHMVGWLRNAFTTMAMMDYPYATSFMSNLPANPVKVACQKMLAGNILTGLASVMDMVYGFDGGLKCHDLDLEYIECGDPTGCGLGSDSIAWDYQVCTEFIMPAGTNNVTDMFPVLPYTLDQRDDYCLKRWGIKPRNDWPAVSFWGRDIKSSSNIVFSNGLLDPWCRGGVLTNVSESVIAILIEGGAHHLDLRGSNPADPDSVVKARQLELKYVMQWIKEAGRRND